MSADEETGWIMLIVSLMSLVAYYGWIAYEEWRHARRFTREIQRKEWGKR